MPFRLSDSLFASVLNKRYHPPPGAIPPELVAEAERLWGTGMFEDYGNKEFDKFAIRARGFPRPEGACFWLEAVGDLDGPALSVVLVRYRGERWVPGGTVQCRVGDKDYTLIPSQAFWDWEQLPDGSYATLTFSNFGVPETREAFAAIIGQDNPVLLRMQGTSEEGESTSVEFAVAEVDLQWLKDTWIIYRAGGGEW